MKCGDVEFKRCCDAASECLNYVGSSVVVLFIKNKKDVYIIKYCPWCGEDLTKINNKISKEMPKVALTSAERLRMLPHNRPPTHPGEMLAKEFLEPMWLSVPEFADMMDLPYTAARDLIECKIDINFDLARRLEDALSMPAEFWINLQKNYDLWHTEKNKSWTITKLEK